MKMAIQLDSLPLSRTPFLRSGSRLTVRLSGFLALTKPRITSMVLVTVATGFLLGARWGSLPSTLALTLLGVALVASGASAWNQFLESDRDAQMRRTLSRPIPSGVVSPNEAWIFGSLLALLGIGLLGLAVNLLSAWLAFLTFVLYVFLYTPLKPVTTLNTALGAIPGALPPVIGWAAATGGLGIEAFTLFFILFLWQFPHFLAIAWIYRDDYARGGHRMLPAVDSSGILVGRQAASHALVLLPVSMLPTVIGLAGSWYFAGAMALSGLYLMSSIRFWADVSDASARRLLRTSVVYLPALLTLLLLNPMPA